MNKNLFFLVITCFLLGCTSNLNSSSSVSLESSLDLDPISSESDSSSLVTNGSFKLEPGDIPNLGESKYHEESTITIGETSFYLDNVQQNSGKYEGISSYIQIKKEEGLLQNITPLGGIVSFAQYTNIVSYSGVTHDYTATLTLKGAHEYEGEYTEITREVREENNQKIYTYQNEDGYRYFSLENTSSYAAYLEYLLFTW